MMGAYRVPEISVVAHRSLACSLRPAGCLQGAEESKQGLSKPSSLLARARARGLLTHRRGRARHLAGFACATGSMRAAVSC